MYTVEFSRILAEPDEYKRIVLCRKAYTAFRGYRGTGGLGRRFHDAEHLVRNLAGVFKGLSFVTEPDDYTDGYGFCPVSLKDHSSFATSYEWEAEAVSSLAALASSYGPRVLGALLGKPLPVSEARGKPAAAPATLWFLEALHFEEYDAHPEPPSGPAEVGAALRSLDDLLGRDVD
jgi:hypothetical protein